MKKIAFIVLTLIIVVLFFSLSKSPKLSLEVDEQTTESFADALTDWGQAIRDGNERGISSALSPQVLSSSWPRNLSTEPLPPPADWAATGKGLNSAPMRSMSSADWLLELESFLAIFSELEDVQIKVVDSEVMSESELSAKWKLSFWGRNQEKQRIWLQISGSALAQKVQEDWKLSKFQIETFQSMSASFDLFTEVSESSGLRVPYRGTGRVETSGTPGACTGDLNGDGWLDIITSDFGGISCYLNQGDGTFVNKGSELFPNSDGNRFQQGLLLADIDNDGDLDLFLSGKKFDTRKKQWVNCGSLQRNLLVEQGELVFEDVSERLGPAGSRLGGYSVASCDLNKDSYPDFFVANWQDYAGQPLFYLASGASEFANPQNGGKNLLFLSQSDGSYSEEAEAWGVAGSDWSFVGTFADLDQDGDQDLIVANDYGPNRLYVNQGAHFQEQAEARGADRGGFGMGISVGDFDNDGLRLP